MSQPDDRALQRLTGKTPEDLGTWPRRVYKHADHDLAAALEMWSVAGTEVVAESVPDVVDKPANLLLRGLIPVADRRCARAVLPVHLLALGVERRARRRRCWPSVLRMRASLAKSLADHLRRKKQVVVVNDDQVSRTVDRGHGLGEKLVCTLVSEP